MWRHEMKRTGWAAAMAPLAVVAAAHLLALGVAQRDDRARMFSYTLEMALPLVAGIAAASLVGRDPGLELQLTVPTDYRLTLGRRLLVICSCAGLVCGLLAVAVNATGLWYRWPADPGPWVGQLLWLAPMLWLAGFGFLAASLFGQAAPAVAVVSMAWGLETFVGPLLATSWFRLWYLFATSRGGAPEDWAANRVGLMVGTVVMVAAGWLLLADTERLIRSAAE